MRRRFQVLAVAAVLATLGGLMAVAPAEAAVARCNSNTSTGQIIYSITPPGSFTRYISAKICITYDVDSVRNSTSVFCRTGSGAGCDIRAEVLSAKMQRFNSDGSFEATLSDQYFQASIPGYSSGWGWTGHDNYVGFACTNKGYQARDDDIRVRFGFDGVLRNVGDAWSSRGTLTGC